MAGPTTPFEDDTWQWPPQISYPEQVVFMDACAAQSSRFSYKSIGTSVEGRPIYALYVGYPNAPTDKELRTKACTLVLAGQHGSEPSGREGALQHARDMAFTEDPEMLSYLEKHPMIYLPTVNPDGDSSISGTTSRENANGVGLNGNWAKLTEPETQVASTLLRDHNIVINYDMHQMVPADEQWWFRGTLNVQQDPKMAELKDAYVNMALQSGVNSGLTTGLFDTASTSPNNFRNAGGLSHRITLLSEMQGVSPPTSKKKVECYVNLFDDGVLWHAANEDLVAGNIAESRHNAVEEGLNKVALRDPSIAAPPAGYRVALDDQPTVEMFIDRYNVEWYPITGSTDKYVPLAQMARNMIAPMFDPTHQRRMIAATREDTQPAVTGKKALYNVKILRQSDSKLMHYTGGIEALSLDVGSLDAGETYEWYVQEQQVGEASPWSTMGTFTTAGDATYDVEWRAVGGSTNVITNVPVNQVKLNALSPGVNYEFRVQEVAGSNRSAWSAWLTFRTETEVITAPQGVWAVGVVTKDQTTASLSPTYDGTDADSLEYSLDSAPWVTFTSNIYLTGLTAGTSYDLRLRARNESGTGSAKLTTFTTASEVVEDTSPDSFSVGSLTGQALNQYVEFSPVQVTGIDSGVSIPVDVSGSGFQYAINTGSGYGSFSSSQRSVSLDDLVKVRVKTKNSGLSTSTGTLTIGDKSASLSATTQQVISQSSDEGQYRQGTVSVTEGSQIVTGTNTLFQQQVESGDAFTVVGDGVLYDVASVQSDTELRLSAPYVGQTSTESLYTIARDFTSPDSFPTLTTGDIETPTILTRTIRKIQSKFIEIGTPVGGYMLVGENVAVHPKWREANGSNGTLNLSSSAPTGTKYIMKVE